MDLGKRSCNYHDYVSVSASSQKLRKLRKSVNAVLQVVRLLKSMRRLCVDPTAVRIEQGPVRIPTSPRKAQENLNPRNDQYEYSRHLALTFSNNIGGPIYTGLPVGDQEGSSLDLLLIDSCTQKIIKSGPEASAKVEIVALEKDFTSYAGEKLLIRGDPHVSLKDGMVSVSHISFKHTRIPMRKRELRLGARVTYPYDIGNRIMEAVTEPFFVKDRRSMGKSLKPLSLDDEVWKLQTIGKGGAFHDRLVKENIKTVRDLLTCCSLNREKLLRLLGRRMSAKKLDAAIKQAKSKLVLKSYLYSSANSQENHPVVFTEVGELIGVLYQEGQFVSVEQLTPNQKACAIELVKEAFEDGHQNSKVLDDDNFKKIFSSSSPTVFDDSNGFSCEAYYPSDTQQHPVRSSANFLPSTSTNTTATNNYDSIISQINSSAIPTGALVPDENHCTYECFWEYYY
ncbi:unnamed protein product [Withania somnifera]